MIILHEQDKYDDNLFINDSNYFMSKKLFQALFNTEKYYIYLFIHYKFFIIYIYVCLFKK